MARRAPPVEFIRMQRQLEEALACTSCGKRRRVTLADRTLGPTKLKMPPVERFDPTIHCSCPETPL